MMGRREVIQVDLAEQTLVSLLKRALAGRCAPGRLAERIVDPASRPDQIEATTLDVWEP